MKRLNPLYIIALFATILFLSFYLLKEEQKVYEKNVKNYNSLEEKAQVFSDYRSSWNNLTYIEKTINSILRVKPFVNEKVLKVKTNEIIKIKMESANPKVLDRFLNKVLNKKLKIKKLELNKSFIYLEIGLK